MNSSSSQDGSVVASYSSLTTLTLVNNILDCSAKATSSFDIVDGLIDQTSAQIGGAVYIS